MMLPSTGIIIWPGFEASVRSSASAGGGSGGCGLLARRSGGGRGVDGARRRRRRPSPRRAAGGGDRRGCGRFRRGDGDQEILALAHGEIGVEPVPVGERPWRHVVEPRDGEGGLAALDAVAERLGAGLHRGRRGGGGRAAGLRAVDRAARDGGDVDPAGLDRPGGDRAGGGRGFGDAARQDEHLAAAEGHARGHAVEGGEFRRRQADAARDIRHAVARLGHGDLVARVGDDAAVVRARARGEGLRPPHRRC
jgi:hypothetical protein